MTTISQEEFERIEMRVGRVMSVEGFPEARRPSYLMTIDFGPDVGIKRSSAAIGKLYRPDELEGRLVVAVTNFPAKQIANRMSEALVLAAVNPDGSMRLLQPDEDVELGARVK
jgi:tRNA-binding protein